MIGNGEVRRGEERVREKEGVKVPTTAVFL